MIFEESNIIYIHMKRQTMLIKDLELARRIRGEHRVAPYSTNSLYFDSFR